MTTLPDTLRVNAWTGTEAPTGSTGAESLRWALRRRVVGPSALDTALAPPVPADLRDWRHPKVGWGLVLPDIEGVSDAERATADDAPEPIRRLVASRSPAPVLRYRDDLTQGFLRRYYPDRPHQDLSLAGSVTGVDVGELPRYLLIYAPPDVVPWTFQYTANLSTFVGRLTLAGTALERYVDALVTDWNGSTSVPGVPLVWSVNHGAPDITWLMDGVISRRLCEAYGADADMAGHLCLRDAAATSAGLIAALQAHQPGLVVSTSHGMTGPLNDATRLTAQLGIRWTSITPCWT